MIKSLTILFRKMANDLALSVLIILGLFLSFSVAIILATNVQHHSSFDRFHKDYERIFNLYIYEKYQGTRDIYNQLPMAFGETTQQLFPEVDTMTRIKRVPEAFISNDLDNNFKEQIFYVEPSFFHIFKINWLSGNSNVLVQSNEVCVSRSLAQKLFGNDNPLGKYIKINGKEYNISGVFKDYPTNSHLKFSALLPLSDYISTNDPYKWSNYEFQTYVKLKKGADYVSFEKKIQTIVRTIWVPWLKKNLNLNYVFNASNSLSLKLIPVSDIHLKSSSISGFENISSLFIVFFNIAIVLVLILIAYFNVVSFAISKGRKEKLQLSIKRYLGISKKKFVNDFVLQVLLFSILAFVMALFFVIILWESRLSIVNRLFPYELNHNLLSIALLFVLIISIASVAGYGLGLFFFRISRQLRSIISYSGFWLNRMMLIGQISVAITLLLCIAFIYKQFSFISHYSLGINTANVIIIDHPEGIRNNYNAFENELKKSPLIDEIVRSNAYPFGSLPNENYSFGDVAYPFQYLKADTGFQRIFNIKLKAGRWFSNPDENAIVLNETAVKVLGVKNPLGTEIHKTLPPFEKYLIIGVVSDFHFHSLHHKIEPLIISPLNKNDWWRYVVIKGSNKERQQLHAEVKKVWDRFSSVSIMDDFLLKDKMNGLYENDKKSRVIIGLFSIVAILISCFGLLGTIINVSTEKTKEIGIRKVNGASVFEINTILVNNISKWILIAFVLACPVAYLAMNKWLQDFAYKTEISWWIFALIGISIFIIVAFTVIWQSWRAASRNPVEALRYE